MQPLHQAPDRREQRESDSVSRVLRLVNRSFFALLAIAQLECTERGGAGPETPSSEPSSAHDDARSSGRAELISLEVSGFKPAIVALPNGSDRARPVLIAAHGAGDTPEWQCEIWNQIVRRRGYILCPRGRPMTLGVEIGGAGWYFSDHHALGREVLAALSALEQRFGAAVDATAVVYTGYSQGASMGALFSVKHASRFPRLVLIEGGVAEWDVPTARAYKRGGGVRVLFACGQGGCAARARKNVRWLERAGLQARAEYAPGGGHTYDGAVGELVASAFEWLIADDARWH